RHLQVADRGLVVTGPGEIAAVGGEREPCHPPLVAPRARGNRLVLLDVPQPHSAGVPAGGEGAAVGREGDGADPLVLGTEGVDQLAADDVPEADGSVAAGRGEAVPIGGEGDGLDVALVTTEVTHGDLTADPVRPRVVLYRQWCRSAARRPQETPHMYNPT